MSMVYIPEIITYINDHLFQGKRAENRQSFFRASLFKLVGPVAG